MSGKVKKQLVLKRCFNPFGSNISLESVIIEIERAFPKNEDRMASIDLFRSQIVSYVKKPNNGGSGIFIGFCVQDKSATGLVDTITSTNEVGVEEYNAPENKAWLDSEVILYVVENHVIACNIGNKEKAITQLLTDLARKGNILGDQKHIVLSDVPNKLTIENVNKIGVKRIDLDISSYLTSLDYIKPKKATPSFLKSIFSSPTSIAEVRRRNETTARVYLKRGKFKKEEVRKDEWLTMIGTEIIKEEPKDYTITLEDGSKIGTSTLHVSKSVDLNRHGNSFNREHSHLELINYYAELNSSGKLRW